MNEKRLEALEIRNLSIYLVDISSYIIFSNLHILIVYIYRERERICHVIVLLFIIPLNNTQRIITYRMRAPISRQSKKCLHKMAEV